MTGSTDIPEGEVSRGDSRKVVELDALIVGAGFAGGFIFSGILSWESFFGLFRDGWSI